MYYAIKSIQVNNAYSNGKPNVLQYISRCGGKDDTAGIFQIV